MKVRSLLYATALLAALNSGTAWATVASRDVWVTAEFLSFETLAWPAGSDNEAQVKPNVNGVLLSSDASLGTEIVNGTEWGKVRTVFATPVQRIDFVYGLSYDPGDFPPRPNVFEFIQNPDPEFVVGPPPTDPFKLGTLRYVNGQWFPAVKIGVRLTTESDVSELDGHVFEGMIYLTVNSSATGDVYDEADFFYVTDLLGSPLTGSVRVFDYYYCPPGDPSAPNCNDGSAELIGHIASLDPTEFANPTGGSFLSQSTDTGPVPTPAPAPLGLLGAGLLASGWMRRRRG